MDGAIAPWVSFFFRCVSGILSNLQSHRMKGNDGYSYSLTIRRNLYTNKLKALPSGIFDSLTGLSLL